MGSSVCLGKLVKIPENASVFQSSFVTYNTEKDNMFLQPDVLRNRIEQEYMWHVARFGIICTILKTWKAPLEESYF